MRINPCSYYYNQAPVVRFGAANTSAKPTEFASIDASNFPSPVKEAMKRIAKEPVEHGILFTKEGKLVKEVIGDKQTPFPNTVDWLNFAALAKQYPDWIFVHNHPSLDYNKKPIPITFSDVYAAGACEAKSAVAVHADGTYSSVEGIRNWILEQLMDLAHNTNPYENGNYSGSLLDKYWKEEAQSLGVTYTNTANYE